MEQSFAPDVIDQLRAAIAGADGNEVFFLGRTDHARLVIEVEVLARGHQGAVPAVLQPCRYGDVIIHNHPSGGLEPSTADLSIASSMGSLGVGFYIINNDASSVYRVVEPFRRIERAKLEPEGIAAVLGPGGAVAQRLPGYEDRPEQLRMAFTIGEALNTDGLAVIEAGTGTGKSLAYLVPAILWARENEERVVVSTNTINLQEQLIRKDIPFLQRAAGLEFRAVLVKGRGNYVCRRRLEAAGSEPGLFEAEKSGELAAIRDWAENAVDGSRDDLSFTPQGEVWDEVCSEADLCGRAKCPDYGRCFFHRARRLAAQADLLVVNHALLLTDLALRLQTDNYTTTAVLPPYDRVILDEAHHLEDAATSHFSGQTTRFAFGRVLGRLRHPRKPEQGLLARLLKQLGEDLPDSLDALYRDLHGRIDGLTGSSQALFERAVQTLEWAGETLARAVGERVEERREVKARVLPALRQKEEWRLVDARLRELAAATEELAVNLRGLLRRCEDLPEVLRERHASLLLDIGAMGGRLLLIAETLRLFLLADEDRCAWFEVAIGRAGRGRMLITRLCSAPLEIADSLHRGLFSRFRTVVMTSATLAVDRKFDYFRHRVGLDRAEAGRLKELLLASPFDFARQALLAVPADIPEPDRPGYFEAVRDAVERAVLAAGGRTFVLCTAYGLLTRLHAELSPILSARGLRPLKQGEDNRHRLLKRFATEEGSVLFATDSFWEGVDVPGRALEQVIITRLPFRVPTEPVLQARAEAISARGGDPFRDYTVPQAVIRFKQGFGRLIRRHDDRGVVLLLDSRAATKGYGRIFLRSLPEARQAIGPLAETMAELERMWREVPKTVVDPAGWD